MSKSTGELTAAIFKKNCYSLKVNRTREIAWHSVYSQFTLEALERLKKFSERLSAELLVVLGGDLDADLQVLTDVCRQHGPQTLQGVLH